MRNSSALAPVFVGVRMAVHIVFVGLVVYVMVRASERADQPLVAQLVGCAMIVVYLVGSFRAHWRPNMALRRGALSVVWLVVLTGLWVWLAVLSPDAAFIIFPLFFLYLELLDSAWAVLSVLATTAISIVTLTNHIGYSVGGILGPCLGASVAVVVGLGYRALTREADERQRLIDELVATRAELALTEREAGRMAERERLARDIHDTVAQALSSIQLLLHAVERQTVFDDNERSLDQLKLTRQTAADALLETRRIIRELTPPALDDRTLVAALQRLAEATQEQLRATGAAQAHAVVVSERRGDPRPLPMSVETTLLRIAQGMTANVVRHSQAVSAALVLDYGAESVTLTMTDDGRGFDFDPSIAGSAGASFGLTAIKQRVAALDGTLVVESALGEGTRVSITVPIVDEDQLL